jgi:hypothetical protein
MKKFYFVGGPKTGQAEAFFRRLHQIGGTPSGWRIYPRAVNDGKALHIVDVESQDEILNHLQHFALPHKYLPLSASISLFLRFGTGLSSKTASSLINSGAGEEHGLRERERRRSFMRQAGMRSLSPQQADRPLEVSRGRTSGTVVAFSGHAGSVMILQ